MSFVRDDAGFFISQYGDYHDSARLPLPDAFERLPLRGAPVAMAISRNGLVVTGEDEEAALVAMAGCAEAEVGKATRPTAYIPLVLRDRRWELFKPTRPGLEPLCRLSLKQALWDYDAQKRLLEGYFEPVGRGVFVGSLKSIVHDDRGYSFTVWTRNVATLLRPADAVVIFRGESQPLLARRWDDVAAACGPSVVAEDFYPPRVFVGSGPTDEQMAAREANSAHPEWMPRGK